VDRIEPVATTEAPTAASDAGNRNGDGQTSGWTRIFDDAVSQRCMAVRKKLTCYCGGTPDAEFLIRIVERPVEMRRVVTDGRSDPNRLMVLL